MKRFVLQLTKNVAQVAMFCVLFCFCAANLMAQTHRLSGPYTEYITSTDRYEWIVPDGVTELKIEGVGGGGAGGFRIEIPTSQGTNYSWQWSTGGGGGAAYARVNALAVEPGQKLITYVGAKGLSTVSTRRNGGNTLVYYQNESNLVLKAEGGKSVLNDRDNIGKAGGSKDNCVGDVAFSGGKGGNGYYNRPWINTTASGSGGGAAGSNGDGSPGVDGTSNHGWAGGSGGNGDLGGAGGAGKNGYNQNGGAGGNYGGGGGGGNSGWVNESADGGAGGPGVIRITYYVDECYHAPVISTVAPPEDRCAGYSEYYVVATVTPGAAAITTYTWTGDVQGTTATGVVYPTDPNDPTYICGKTYSYTFSVMDANNCASDTVSGSFTISNPAISFNTIPTQTGTKVSESPEQYGVPDITDVLKASLATGCANTLIVTGSTPAPGAILEHDLTTVTYHVKDMCGNTFDKDVSIYNPLEPDGGGGGIVPGSLTLSLTADKERLCATQQATLTANVSGGTGPYTYSWTGTGLQDGGADNVKKTTATTDIPTTETSATYSVLVTDHNGLTANASITIYTNPAASNLTDVNAGENCAPFSYTYTPASVPANTNYTWQITSNDGVQNASSILYPQSQFYAYALKNTALETKTVVYTVSTTTTTGGVACPGNDFNITIKIKPSIENDANFEFNTTDASATLWYGACDTLMTLDVPTYHTDITEYASSLTLTPNMGTINSDGKLEIRLAAGENVIVWTITDPCGYSVSKTQTITVNYPPCTGTVSDGSGNSYEVVRVGCECWTKSNLKAQKYVGGGDIASAEGYYSADNPNTDENIDKFGRLYTWYSAVNVTEGDDNATPTLTTEPTSHMQYVQGICPQGWAIPSQESFQSAFTAAGGTDNLKSSDGNLWLPGGAGTDASGFSAVGAGYYDSNIDRYVNLLGETYWWDDEAVTISEAACSSITHTCPYLLSTKMNKHFGLSVRCVRRAN